MEKSYEERRKQTLETVQKAIDELKNEGQKVTKKALMEKTGLSTGTFSKDHVKALLKANRVCQYAPDAKKRHAQKAAATKNAQSFASFQMPLKSGESVKVLGSEMDEAIDDFTKSLMKENEELRKEIMEKELQYQHLRGKYDAVSQLLKESVLNIDVNDKKDSDDE